MKNIDINKLRARWQESDGSGFAAGGDDTVLSLQILGEKVNEIIDFLQPDSPEKCCDSCKDFSPESTSPFIARCVACPNRCHKPEVSQRNSFTTQDNSGSGTVHVPQMAIVNLGKEDCKPAEPSFIDKKVKEFKDFYQSIIGTNQLEDQILFLRTALNEAWSEGYVENERENFKEKEECDLISFNAGRLAMKEEIEEIINTMTEEVHEMDSEAFGWDLVRDGCCPGDDAAGGYEEALKRLQAAIRDKE